MPQFSVRASLSRFPLTRVALWATPLLSLGAAVIGVHVAREEADLARAVNLLHSGQATTARRILERHEVSPWGGRPARAGLALCHALAGSEGAASGAVGCTDLARFNLPMLLDSSLRRGSPEATLRLARIAENCGEPLAAIYETAALVELGRDEAARNRLAGREGLFGSRGIGRRAERVLELRDGGAATFVHDRRGTLAGSLDAAGQLTRLEDLPAAWFPRALPPAVRGAARGQGIRLSLDFPLTRLALSALGRYRGSIVLLDTTTGAVLAAVSDSRSQRGTGTPAFDQTREPASIAKLITTTAALRAGLDPDAEIARMTCRGAERYGEGVLWCSFKAGKLRGLSHALAVSCNIAFANLGIAVGREALLAEYRRYGFDLGDEEMLGAAGSVLQTRGGPRQLADLSIGLEASEITTLHAALIAAVFANGGVMPRPALVVAGDGALGLSPEPLPLSRGRRVVESAWIPRVREAMKAVVTWGGTAAGLSPRSFPVAMKTGTAAQWRRGYHVNYIGFGPLPEPGIAFCVRVTHQRTSTRVNRAAREVTRALLEGLGRLRELGKLG
jgi:peptidoglycan glycosyltransferase